MKSFSKMVFSAVALLGGTPWCFAQNQVYAEIDNNPNVYKKETYAVCKEIRVSNQRGRFAVKNLLTKPDANFNQKRTLHLDCGTYGFSPAVRFLGIEVNGIRDDKLPLDAADMALWSEEDKKGGEILYNFDGAKLKLIFFMRPDSPVLWFRILPEKSMTVYRSIKINVTGIVSAIQIKNGKAAFQGGYHRKALTAARTLSQQKVRHELNSSDRYLILLDEVHDGSAKDRGMGPCYIALGKSPVKSAALSMDDYWTATLELRLPLDFKEYTFGVWQARNGISNKAFLEKFEKEKSLFLP